MGRTLKRVSLDFDWPVHTTWEGYLNPHYKKCQDCENGTTADAEWLEAIVSLILLAGEPKPRAPGALHPHPYLTHLLNRPGRNPTPRMSELSTGLAGRAPSVFGHDAIDRWTAQKKIIAAAGLPEDWGICKTCKGDALDPAVKALHEAWEKFEPPTGEGFQLWETTSEGSPISPVFATLDALCEWAATNATTFGSCRASAADWKRMLNDGLVCHQQGNAVFL